MFRCLSKKAIVRGLYTGKVLLVRFSTLWIKKVRRSQGGKTAMRKDEPERIKNFTEMPLLFQQACQNQRRLFLKGGIFQIKIKIDAQKTVRKQLKVI